MTETFEFRVQEPWATRIFGTAGRRLSSDLRLIRITRDDLGFAALGSAQREAAVLSRDWRFFSWDVNRMYSEREIKDAELARLVVEPRFRPTGEECGTLFDKSNVCSFCGYGRIQLSRLNLDLRKLPKARGLLASFA